LLKLARTDNKLPPKENLAVSPIFKYTDPEYMLLLKSLFHLLEFTFFYIINRRSIIPKIARAIVQLTNVENLPVGYVFTSSCT
jgi:hypothetical protein